MGVCKRAVTFDTPFYMWNGWDFINVIGLLIAIGLFYYAYIHIHARPPSKRVPCSTHRKPVSSYTRISITVGIPRRDFDQLQFRSISR
ncbi:unnamed protein product [Heterotrigona itama]|uniref:Uncharacterized protein n=1 Tax=Heterotrigona itama TaxID=395501 RepID=A0A6V7HLT1_9HYME|nr:unnamed protein product [Heterotrigona itama]